MLAIVSSSGWYICSAIMPKQSYFSNKLNANVNQSDWSRLLLSSDTIFKLSLSWAESGRSHGTATGTRREPILGGLSIASLLCTVPVAVSQPLPVRWHQAGVGDRKSTRLNSSHV